ncbi:peptidase [Nonomuraea helvata]
MRGFRLRPSVRRVLIAGTAAVLMGGAMVVTAPASGAAAPNMKAPAEAVAVPAPVSPDVAQVMSTARKARTEAVLAYWTEERMRKAIPAPESPGKHPTQESPSDIQSAVPRTVQPAAPPSLKGVERGQAGRGTSQNANVLVNASIAVGKVFYRNAVDGRDYVCSAGAINSPSKRIVSTAGHCVHGGSGGNWHQNWVFVPYYNYGNRPYGTFAANWLISFNGWINNGNFDYDVGFVKTFNNERGQILVDTVGGHGFQTGQPKSRSMTMLGYPSESPYPGDWQYFCQGTTSASGSNQITMGCPLTRGQSGGPWLASYNDSTGLGYVNGTSSTLDRIVNPTQWWSPYFDNPDWDLYNYADQIS